MTPYFEVTMLAPFKGNAMKRFFDKVNIPDNLDNCWRWEGRKCTGGYGFFHLNGKERKAHRVSWELAYGPIPKDFYICHHCDNPSCVNLSHLFVGTHSENMFDSSRKKRHVQSRKTHCPKGHEYSGSNLRISNGRRYCRACVKENTRRYRR